jgi:excinuclease UvrABC nuclease subunit
VSACVYRALDPDGNVLYIGSTLDCQRRLGDHGRNAPWWTRVGTVEVQHYDTPEEAQIGEAEAILRERPEFNRRLAAAPRTWIAGPRANTETEAA